jgi:hypothetical protein
MIERVLRIPTAGITLNSYEQPLYHAGIAHGFIGGIIIMLLISIAAFHSEGWRKYSMQQRLKKAEDMV